MGFSHFRLVSQSRKFPTLGQRGRKTVRIVKNYSGSKILRIRALHYFQYGRILWALLPQLSFLFTSILPRLTSALPLLDLNLTCAVGNLGPRFGNHGLQTLGEKEAFSCVQVSSFGGVWGFNQGVPNVPFQATRQSLVYFSFPALRVFPQLRTTVHIPLVLQQSSKS